MSDPVTDLEKKKKKEKKEKKKEKKAKKEAAQLAAATPAEPTPAPAEPQATTPEPTPVATVDAPKEKKQKKEKKSKKEKTENAPAPQVAQEAVVAQQEVKHEEPEAETVGEAPVVESSAPAQVHHVEPTPVEEPKEQEHQHHAHESHKVEHHESHIEHHHHSEPPSVEQRLTKIEARLDALEAVLSPENLKTLIQQVLQGGSPQQSSAPAPTLQGSVSAVELRSIKSEVTALQSSYSVDSNGGASAAFKPEDEELQDLGNWEDSLPKDAKDLVVKYDLSKRCVWNFGPHYALGPDEIKAICDAVQQGPKQKKITKVAFNFSSADNRLRTSKELAVALTEKPTLKELVLFDVRRQSGWTFLGGLVDADSSVVSVVLEDMDLPEAWSGAQAVKIISSCKWTEFVIQNSKRNNAFKREDVNPFYDNLVTGLASNKTVTRFTLKNIPGASNGDVSRLVDGLRKNKSVTHLTIALEDVWDRLKIKSLADFIRTSPQLEELNISGVDKTIFDINDWITALETSTLKRLIVSTLDVYTAGKKSSKGMLIDKYLEDKLKAICDKNGHLVIVGMREGAIPKELVISPTPQ